MNRTTNIALTIGSQLATMLAASIVLITVAEGIHWWCFFSDRKR